MALSQMTLSACILRQETVKPKESRFKDSAGLQTQNQTLCTEGPPKTACNAGAGGLTCACTGAWHCT